MRIFLAGASGVLGKSLLPLLLRDGHEVTGTTRSAAKAKDIARTGAIATVVDALDAGALKAAVQAARPQVVIHQLTDLPSAPGTPGYEEGQKRNNRLRAFLTSVSRHHECLCAFSASPLRLYG